MFWKASNWALRILTALTNMLVGLNLTACNNVILVDMWWNPALEVRQVLGETPPIIELYPGSSVRPCSSLGTNTRRQHL